MPNMVETLFGQMKDVGGIDQAVASFLASEHVDRASSSDLSELADALTNIVSSIKGEDISAHCKFLSKFGEHYKIQLQREMFMDIYRNNGGIAISVHYSNKEKDTPRYLPLTREIMKMAGRLSGMPLDEFHDLNDFVNRGDYVSFNVLIKDGAPRIVFTTEATVISRTYDNGMVVEKEPCGAIFARYRNRIPSPKVIVDPALLNTGTDN